MIHHVCAVRDDAVGAFQVPFFTRSTGEAVRGFSDAVQNPDTPFHKHAKDYSLWLLGLFDDNTGSFEHGVAGGPAPSPQLIVLAMNLLEKKSPSST